MYACGNCGDVYGSFEIIPSAKYCKKCGARMKLKGAKQ
jgi:rubredoxin